MDEKTRRTAGRGGGEKVLITRRCTLHGRALRPGQEIDVPQWFARRMYRAQRARPAPSTTNPVAAAAEPVIQEESNG